MELVERESWIVGSFFFLYLIFVEKQEGKLFWFGVFFFGKFSYAPNEKPFSKILQQKQTINKAREIWICKISSQAHFIPVAICFFAILSPDKRNKIITKQENQRKKSKEKRKTEKTTAT